MRTIITIAALLLLVGCQSEAEYRDEWISKQCTPSGFTEAQCGVLYAVKKNASDDANMNAAATGLAIGLGAGAVGGRR